MFWFLVAFEGLRCSHILLRLTDTLKILWLKGSSGMLTLCNSKYCFFYLLSGLLKNLQVKNASFPVVLKQNLRKKILMKYSRWEGLKSQQKNFSQLFPHSSLKAHFSHHLLQMYLHQINTVGPSCNSYHLRWTLFYFVRPQYTTRGSISLIFQLASGKSLIL